MPRRSFTANAAALASLIAPDRLNAIGRETGFTRRLRTLTPVRVLLALVSALAAGRVAHIADLLRVFNGQHQRATRYKAFYNRLARAAFPRFLSRVVTDMLAQLCVRGLSAAAQGALARFRDIVIQDGSAFHVHPSTPRDAFGGISKQTPAVRLHATMSVLDDAVQRVVLTGNLVAETSRRIDPEALTGKLYLADRAYAAKPVFAALVRAGATFVIRLSKSFDPFVVAIHQLDGNRIPLPRKTRPRLSHFLAQLPIKCADVDVDLGTAEEPLLLRVVVFPGNDPHGTRLCTNATPAELPAEAVGDAYRLRWQIELLFKEWKSYTNLHRWQTENRHILEGLIWAALAAAILVRFMTTMAQIRSGVVLSTQAAAKSAHGWIRAFINEIAQDPKAFNTALDVALDFLASNVPRMNLKRDRKSGRFRSLEPLRDH